MKRRDFLTTTAAWSAGMCMMDINQLTALSEDFGGSDPMPVLFIGHGNPMHALWDNPFTRSLAAVGRSLQPKPTAILVVSAHWLTRGTYVAVTPKPATIYDFGGFPDELYRVKYPAPGAPDIAREVQKLAPDVREDAEWGLDHGAWTVLKHMVPEADIPVFQMSIDYHRPMQYHVDLAKKLRALRNRGVLVVGSGNIVHNLRMWFARQEGAPYDWATEFDTWIKDAVDRRDIRSLVDYEQLGSAATLSVPTVDHYVPVLYSMALADEREPITHFYEEVTSAISMRCFRIG